MKHIIVYSPHSSALLMVDSKKELPPLNEQLPYIKLNDEYAVSFTADRGLHISGCKFQSFLFLNLADDMARAIFAALGMTFSYMPGYHEKMSSLFSEFCLDIKEKLTFFGGSFNPWHAGHESCIELCQTKESLVILPDNNPLKEESTNQLWANFKKILYVQKSYPEMTIYTGFWADKQRNPTANWLIPLKEKYKKNIGLLLGHDSFVGLEKWQQYEKLISCLDEVQIVSREDDPRAMAQKKEQYLSINKDLSLIELGHHPFEALSSSKIRQN